MRYWFWMTIAIWRALCGRWHVWRDDPTDVVRTAASLWRAVRDDTDDDARNVIAQARAEAKLRARETQR